jgi:hypothetical protein
MRNPLVYSWLIALYSASLSFGIGYSESIGGFYFRLEVHASCYIFYFLLLFYTIKHRKHELT